MNSRIAKIARGAKVGATIACLAFVVGVALKVLPRGWLENLVPGIILASMAVGGLVGGLWPRQS